MDALPTTAGQLPVSVSASPRYLGGRSVPDTRDSE